jgi:hypothetical protein
LALPPPPAWSWKKGKLAVMTVELVAGQASVEWTLDDVKGWKVEEPKR